MPVVFNAPPLGVFNHLLLAVEEFDHRAYSLVSELRERLDSVVAFPENILFLFPYGVHGYQMFYAEAKTPLLYKTYDSKDIDLSVSKQF